MYGFYGRVLRIDLSEESYEIKDKVTASDRFLRENWNI